MAWLAGTGGNDKLVDNLAVDHILGYGGKDIIRGLDGDDRIETGRGNDRAFGGSGIDTFIEEATRRDAGIKVRNVYDGGADYDGLSLTVGKGFSARNDVVKVNLGAGTLKITNHNYLDTLKSIESVFIDTKLRVVIKGGTADEHLESGAGNDLLVGNGGFDVLWGRDGRDVLRGNADGDDLHGGSGNDRLLGGNGDDYLHGDEGDDLLRGAAGSDWMRGGAGVDRLDGGADLVTDYFVFQDVTDSGPALARMDRLFNFVPGTDKINLIEIDANTWLGGDDAFAFNGNAGPAANAVWFERDGADVLVFADTDGDATADIGFRIANITAVEAGDFYL